MELMKGLIARAEEACKPRAYVVNRNTNKIHRALTYFADVGMESICYCGFKYGRASVKMLKELPEGDSEHICGTCMPELKQG